MCPAGFGGLSFLPLLSDLGSRILEVAKELIISCPNFFTDVMCLLPWFCLSWDLNIFWDFSRYPLQHVENFRSILSAWAKLVRDLGDILVLSNWVCYHMSEPLGEAICLNIWLKRSQWNLSFSRLIVICTWSQMEAHCAVSVWPCSFRSPWCSFVMQSVRNRITFTASGIRRWHCGPLTPGFPDSAGHHCSLESFI